MNPPSVWHGIESWAFVVLGGYVANYYAETMAIARIPMSLVVCGSVGVSALGLMIVEWLYPSAAGFSFITIVAAVLLIAGFWFNFEQGRIGHHAIANIGASPSVYEGGDGFSASSFSPLRSSSTSASASFQVSLAPLLQSLMVRLKEDSDARHIFYFLSINLAFMFVEFLYGIWSNSLGLISDAAHMLFDCLALAIGLCALVIAEWKPNQSFTFGYDSTWNALGE
jgi:hypothetical protein